MRKLWHVAVWEYIIRVRSKWFWIATIAFPVFIIGFSVVPSLLMTRQTAEVKDIGVIDDTGKFIHEILKENAQQSEKEMGGIFIFQKYENLDFAHEDVMDGVLEGYVHLTDEFEKFWLVDYFSENASAVISFKKIERILTEILRGRKFDRWAIPDSARRELQMHVHLKTTKITAEGEEESNEIASFAGPFGAMYLLFMIIFINSQILMRSVIMDRQNKVIEVLISSLTPRQLMSGKILGIGMFAFTQLAIYILMIIGYTIYSGIPILTYVKLPILVIFFVLGFLMYASLYTGVGSLFTNEQEANQVMGPLGFIAVMPIILSTMIIQSPDSTAAIVLQYIPIFTPFIMLIRAGVATVEWWEIAIGVVLMLITTWGFITVFGKIFRTAILMTGKRPTLKEIIRWFGN